MSVPNASKSVSYFVFVLRCFSTPRKQTAQNQLTPPHYRERGRAHTYGQMRDGFCRAGYPVLQQQIATRAVKSRETRGVRGTIGLFFPRNGSNTLMATKGT